MIIIAILVDALSFGIAGFFLIYGVRAGIIQRRILADFQGGYETGQQAMIRGVFYVIIGLLFLAGSILVAFAVAARSTRG